MKVYNEYEHLNWRNLHAYYLFLFLVKLLRFTSACFQNFITKLPGIILIKLQRFNNRKQFLYMIRIQFFFFFCHGVLNVLARLLLKKKKARISLNIIFLSQSLHDMKLINYVANCALAFEGGKFNFPAREFLL